MYTSRRSAALISLLSIFAGFALGQPATPPQHVPAWTPRTPAPAFAEQIVPGGVALSATSCTALVPGPLNTQGPSGNGSGRVTGIAAHPTDANTIYVAPAGGGVWKTTNGGTSWTPLTDNQATLSMGAVAISVSNPNVIYAGTGEANNSGDSNFGRGILVSTDAGATWALRTGPGGVFNRLAVSQIAVNPTNANTAYAAFGDFAANGLFSFNTGIYKTTDGGITWTNTTTAIDTVRPWSDVQIDPTTPSIVYAAHGDLFGHVANGVYKSIDSGATWNLLTNAPKGVLSGRIALAISKSNHSVVYVTASN